jgi:hypothetical protein
LASAAADVKPLVLFSCRLDALCLRLNGLKVAAHKAGLEGLVRDTAEGRAGKAEIAEFFRRLNC